MGGWVGGWVGRWVGGRPLTSSPSLPPCGIKSEGVKTAASRARCTLAEE